MSVGRVYIHELFLYYNEIIKIALSGRVSDVCVAVRFCFTGYMRKKKRITTTKHWKRERYYVKVEKKETHVKRALAFLFTFSWNRSLLLLNFNALFCERATSTQSRIRFYSNSRDVVHLHLFSLTHVYTYK